MDASDVIRFRAASMRDTNELLVHGPHQTWSTVVDLPAALLEGNLEASSDDAGKMLALICAQSSFLGRAAVPPLVVPAMRRAGSPAMLGSLFGLMPQPEMVKPEDALPGRPNKMSVPDRHFVLGNKMEGPWPEGHKVAIFANGCFWGSEKGVWRLPGEGIYSTAVGYAAGFPPNPTYEEACSGRSGHTEAVQVVYDPAKISFVDIARWMWEAHDPTSGMSQGNDVGTQCAL